MAVFLLKWPDKDRIQAVSHDATPVFGNQRSCIQIEESGKLQKPIGDIAEPVGMPSQGSPPLVAASYQIVFNKLWINTASDTFNENLSVSLAFVQKEGILKK